MRIEKEIFVGFYSVRKLLESVKVSDSTRSSKYELTWFPNVKSVDVMNHHRVDELYDFEKPNSEQRDIGFVCNLFVHSFVFSLVGNDRLEGIIVASDRTKNKKAYLVPLATIQAIFRLMGRDYPCHSVFKRNPETGEVTYSAW